LGTGVIPDNPFIRLNPRDNVVVARVPLPSDAELDYEGRAIKIRQYVGAGHKVAVEDIRQGEIVRKYGENIGVARETIRRGEVVHVHNLLFDIGERVYEFGTKLTDLPDIPLLEENTFLGYPRADGRVGTRNYIAVVGTSNCSAFVVQKVEEAFQHESLEHLGIDGVVGFPHDAGCGQAEGPDSQQLRRLLSNLADHPNIAAAVMVGLGCEVNQVSYYTRPDARPNGEQPVRGFTLQESGGTRMAIADTVKAVREMIASVGIQERQRVSVKHLVAGLECGGSDAFSGITANPGLGYFSDLLVKQGGTTCLSETTEVWGAEHLLTARAIRRDVGERLLEMIDWYKRYVAGFDGAPSFDNNPSPGNKAGGLTNIAEKSLGAVAKGGTSNLMAVYDYAEKIAERGFVFMNTPGYDPPSVAGLAAGGCTVCLFTTGRGSCTGFPSMPVIKVCTNTKTAGFMNEDMDINAGTVADGDEDLPALGKRIYKFVLEVASGRKTFSEQLGHREFVPWRIGPTL
jgi:altronate hydrolase